jgi:alpha-L-fucosidase
MKDYYLLLRNAGTGRQLGRFAEGYGLASAHMYDDKIYVFASRWVDGNWNDVTLFKSSDLKHWETSKVIEQDKDENLFNSSVCEGPESFVMAYESNDPTYPAFTIKFAKSEDLQIWQKVPDAIFGTNRYTACPCIRYANGYYYMLYLETRKPRHYFETYVARSHDLRHWELSAINPVLRPDESDEGINASDPEIIEINGKTYLYYAVGDQLTWANIKRAVYPGTMQSFFESWYAHPGIPDSGTASGTCRG